MRRDGTAVRRLTEGEPGFRIAADWSPDGRMILLTRVVERGLSQQAQVFTMSADGSRARNVSRNRFDENATSWGSGS